MYVCMYVENMKENREQYCADFENFKLRSRTWKIVSFEKEKWKIRKFYRNQYGRDEKLFSIPSHK